MYSLCFIFTPLSVFLNLLLFIKSVSHILDIEMADYLLYEDTSFSNDTRSKDKNNNLPHM